MAAILIAFIATYFILDQKLVTYIAKGTADHIVFKDVSEIEKVSPIIVEVVATAESKTYYRPTSNPGVIRIPDTKTKVQVTKIHKNDGRVTLGSLIEVVERIHIEDKGIIPGKIIYNIENTTKMIPGVKYLLFLEWMDAHQAYGIYGLHQGKINLDGKDQHEIEMQNVNSTFGGFKQSVLKKYGI
jgi:hypothetical protein